MDAVQIALRRITRARAAVAASTAGAMATRSFDGAGGVPPKAISSIPIAVQIIATAIASRGCTATTASPAIEALPSTMNWPNPPVFAPTITLTTTSAASAASATVLGRSRAGAIAMIRNPHAGRIGCTSDTGSKTSGGYASDQQHRAREADHAGEALPSSRPRQQDDQQPDHVKRDLAFVMPSAPLDQHHQTRREPQARVQDRRELCRLRDRPAGAHPGAGPGALTQARGHERHDVPHEHAVPITRGLKQRVEHLRSARRTHGRRIAPQRRLREPAAPHAGAVRALARNLADTTPAALAIRSVSSSSARRPAAVSA